MQGVKYSTFSLISALLGNKKIDNFFQNNPTCLINLWGGCINQNKGFNIKNIEFSDNEIKGCSSNF